MMKMNTGHLRLILGMPVMLLLQGTTLKSHGESNTPPADISARSGESEVQAPESVEIEKRHKVFEQVDTDHDGKLTFGEFCQLKRLKNLEVEKQRKLYDFLDQNGDGCLLADELHPVKPKWMIFIRREFRRFDGNNDAQLDAAEFASLMRFLGKNGDVVKRLFEELDQNKNQKIDLDELRAVRPVFGHGSIDFNLYDKDASGELDYSEFSTMPIVQRWPEKRRQKIFDLIDADGDGEISKSEVGVIYQYRRQPHRLGPDGSRQWPRAPKAF